MQLVPGTVVNGKVEVDGLLLPEGTTVAVLTPDDELTVHLTAEEEQDLLHALDESDRDDGVPAEEFLDRLKRFG